MSGRGRNDTGTNAPGTNVSGTNVSGTAAQGTSQRARIKPGRASLIGGIAVAVASFVIWAAIAGDLDAGTWPWLAAGVVVCAGIGAWIRLADL